MNAEDLCATPGCGHRRDGHGVGGKCWSKNAHGLYARFDGCTGFTEPPVNAAPGDESCARCGKPWSKHPKISQWTRCYDERPTPSPSGIKAKAETLFSIHVAAELEKGEQRRMGAWRQAKVRPVDPPAQPVCYIDGSVL